MALYKQPDLFGVGGLKIHRKESENGLVYYRRICSFVGSINDASDPLIEGRKIRVKRYGILLAFVGLLMIICGAFSFFVKLNSFEKFFLKSRLTNILEAKGYQVLWGMDEYEGEELVTPVRMSKDIRLIHFLETKVGTFCLFEKIPQSRRPIEREDLIILELDIQSLAVHTHNGTLFEVQFGGKVNFANTEELQLMFPFEEVGRMKDWVKELHRKVLLCTGILGIVFLSVGFISLIPLGGTDPRRAREQPVFSPVRKLEAKIPIAKPCHPGAQKEKSDPERRRQELLGEIEEMIRRASGDEETRRLQKIRDLIAQEEPRLKKLEYLFRQALEALPEEGDPPTGIPPVEEAKADLLSPGREDFLSLPHLEKVLAIDHLLPKNLNPLHVKRVLIRGFLHPGGQERFFKTCYLDIAAVRKNAKIPGDKFKPCIQWLLRVGVVIKPKVNKGKILLSLNPDPHSVSSPGSDIIRVILRLAHDLSTQRR